MLVVILLTAAFAVIGLLGLIHLIYTFRSDKLEPRDKELGQQLRQVSPVLTAETSMWKAWVGLFVAFPCQFSCLLQDIY